MLGDDWKSEGVGRRRGPKMVVGEINVNKKCVSGSHRCVTRAAPQWRLLQAMPCQLPLAAIGGLRAVERRGRDE